MTVTWNSGDKSANVTLSGSNLVATTTSNAQGAVRANTSAASGKIYAEFRFSPAPAGNNTAVGWANSTASLASFIGIDKNGIATFPIDGTVGQTWFNNASIGNGGGKGWSGCTVCIAFDITNLLYWVRIGTLSWNNGTGDPGAGTGGYSAATMNAGPYFPAFCANANGQSVTANFGATDFIFPVPSGFSGLDTPATGLTNFNASTKFEGLAATGIPQTAAVSTKFEGLAATGTQQQSAGSTKFEGLATTGTPQQSGGSTKFLAYVILQEIVPIRRRTQVPDEEWHPSIIRRYSPVTAPEVSVPTWRRPQMYDFYGDEEPQLIPRKFIPIFKRRLMIFPIDPRFITFERWSSLTGFGIAQLGEPPTQRSEIDWQRWARDVKNIPELQGLGIPEPWGYTDWRSWALRFNEALWFNDFAFG